MDQCTDSSLETVFERLNAFQQSRVVRVRLLVQDTPIWESASENIMMSISDPLHFYITVQPDNLIQEFAWDLQLSRPLRAFDDIFSVSGIPAKT